MNFRYIDGRGPDWSALSLGISACLHATIDNGVMLLNDWHQILSRTSTRPEMNLSPPVHNMENEIALPERRGASITARDLPDAQVEPDNSNPNPKAPADNGKPPKARKEKAPKTPKPPKGPTPPKGKKETAAKPSVEDPESMFKVGFLSEVYQERPVGPEGINKVITRCQLSI